MTIASVVIVAEVVTVRVEALNVVKVVSSDGVGRIDDDRARIAVIDNVAGVSVDC